ncbi:MAG TPA: TIM barrel protein [Microlunatus sp.]
MSAQPQFGLILRDLPGHPYGNLEAALDAVVGYGATALQLPSITELSPTRDDRELRQVGAAAAARGIRLSAQLGPLNAYWPDRAPELATAGGGDLVRGAVRLAEAASIAGITELHATIGRLEDRTLSTPTWAEQLERNGDLVAAVAAAIEPYGSRLVLKTHEEMSSEETRRMVLQAGHGTGLGFAPVNLLVGMEDPVAAAHRVADVVATVFVDDARFLRAPGGFTRRLEPLGQGNVDWQGVLAAVGLPGSSPSVVLDLLRARFDVAVFDPAWPSHHRHANVLEFTALAAGATSADDRPEAEVPERFVAGVAALTAGLGSESVG